MTSSPGTGFSVKSLLRDSLYRQITTGAIWNLGGTSTARVAALISTIVTLDILGTTNFGGLALVQTTISLLTTLSGFGLAFATTRFIAANVANNKRKAAMYLSTSVSVCLISGIGIGILIVIFGSQFAKGILGDPSLSSALRVGGLLVLLSPLCDIFIGGITGYQRFRTLGWLQGLRGALDALLLITGVEVGGVVGGMLGYAGAEAISCIIAGYSVTQKMRGDDIKFKLGINRRILPSLAKFAVPSLSTSLLLVFTLFFGTILLAHQRNGLASVGVFVFAQRFYLAALFIPGVISTVIFPILTSLVSSGEFSRFRRLLRTYLVSSFFLATFATVLILALAEFLKIVKIHSGTANTETLVILGIVAIPGALNASLGQAAVALRRIGWWLFSDVVLALALLGSALWLVPRHDSVGLAFAYLIGFVATDVAILPAFFHLPRESEDLFSNRVPLLEDAVRVVRPSTQSSEFSPPVRTRPRQIPRSSVFPNTSAVDLSSNQAAPTRIKDSRSLSMPLVLFIGFVAVVFWNDIRGSFTFETYPVLLLGPIVFILIQMISVTARFRLDTPLSPANWGWLLFAYQLVVQPALLISFGLTTGQLSYLPSTSAIQDAFLLSCLAYIAYTVGLILTFRRPALPKTVGLSWDNVSSGTTVTFLVLGAFSLFWYFHSLGSLVNYFSGGFTGVSASGTTSTSISAAASTFLRPLGAYGLIILWARTVRNDQPHRFRLVIMGLGALAIFATYNYNRAAIFVPLVALAAAYGLHVHKVRLRSIVLFGLVVLVAAYSFGNYRSVELATKGGEYSAQSVGLQKSPSLEAQLQVYGGAPQFSAVVVQNLPTLGGFSYGRVAVNDILYPLPIIGRSFRAQSGVAKYNALIYGQTGTTDEVIPFVAEAYWNFGPFGVFGGFLLIGVAVAALQRRFDASQSLLAAFACQYLGMWTAFLIVGGLSSVAQIFIYFTLPLLAISLAPKVRHSSVFLEPSSPPSVLR
jgi:O-antigen/teichoic acid export membrane protein